MEKKKNIPFGRRRETVGIFCLIYQKGKEATCRRSDIKLFDQDKRHGKEASKHPWLSPAEKQVYIEQMPKDITASEHNFVYAEGKKSAIFFTVR